MNVVRLALIAVACATLVAAVPPAAGHHCDTKISVYGRTATTPLVPPPYLSLTQGICVRVFESAGVDDHTLPPHTEQVTVRVNGDFGPTIPTLLLRLDGLGFAAHTFTLDRTANQGGPYNYQHAWVSLPEGAQTGEIKATVYFPSGARSVTYSTTALPPPPLLPPV